MRTRADELDRILIWLLLTGGLIALLVYGLASIVSQPSAETITTHAPVSNVSTQDVNYRPHKTK